MQLGSLAARRPPLLPARTEATDSSSDEGVLRGQVARAQRFRFSEGPGLGDEGAVLEVCVPQVRVKAPAGKRLRAIVCFSRPGAVGRGIGEEVRVFFFPPSGEPAEPNGLV